MFNLAVFNDYLAVVPLTDGVENLALIGVDEVVETARVVVTAALTVGVLLVVDHLVLDAEPFFTAYFGDPIFDPVITGVGEFPIPLEDEIGIFFLGEHKTRALGRREFDDATFFGGPTWLGLIAIGAGEIVQGEFHRLGGKRHRSEEDEEEGGELHGVMKPFINLI